MPDLKFLNAATAWRVAAMLGFLGVALGAFGAHALKDWLTQHGFVEVWEKAVLYHLVHVVVLLVLASRDPLPALAYGLIFTGVLIFSGSLYLLAFTGMRWLGAVTPLGGLSLLAGWAVLAWKH